MALNQIYMKKKFHSLAILASVIAGCSMDQRSAEADEKVRYELISVRIDDHFWSPKLRLWQTKTVNDVFDKFEGKYQPEGKWLENDFKVLGVTRDAFLNFDLVAQGKRAIGKHHGPPWYDGLIYETIRGSADLLRMHPDSVLEKRMDGYIDRIAKAQASEKDGYINTYTQLMEPTHRWGFNGGMLRWQHDVYNAGMLVEAGVHYYQATGKTKLLEVAVRMANHMYQEMGPPPKKNIVPAHSGPEEALLKLHQLFTKQPQLKDKFGVPVDEQNYYKLVKFWIDGRGKHVGLPDWAGWGGERSEKWIRDVKYDDPKLGDHRRPTWGNYSQDSVPVFEQKAIVGHAVRATLLATGIAALAVEENDQRYKETAKRLWDNMVGRRMFITGGVGAIAEDEKFGDDYFLPNDAYLETCAAVGAGFFSQRMNTLTGQGKYMDELERVLYNGVLTGISISGDNYTYQNPLISNEHHRWGWHDCPCCPPMFLKIVAALPDFIYSVADDGIRVNLFAGSTGEFKLGDDNGVVITQVTDYPWAGSVVIEVDPRRAAEFALKVRIPGWAVGIENPFGLYKSIVKEALRLTINGEPVDGLPQDGYVTINRDWKKGDKVELSLPMEARLVRANENVNNLNGMVAIASGPLVYCVEQRSNNNLDELVLDPSSPLEVQYDPGILGGLNVITGKGRSTFTAMPYFAVGNLWPEDSYKVWLPVKGTE